MGRESTRDKTVRSIQKRLKAMAQESLTSLEAARSNARKLSNLGLAGASEPEDFDLCPVCGFVRFKKRCKVCP